MAGNATGNDGGRGSAAQSDPVIGRLIAGRFRVLDLIARGGMGRVYRAEQKPLGRICALKVLHPREDADDPEFQKRFLLEAATAAKLTHPNTVTIFDYGRDGELYYIAMEYIRGRTLFRALRENGPFEEARVVRMLKQVCRSLREAHQNGVIHRDMKPGNLVLVDDADESDTVKVLDFGLVKRVDDGAKEDLTQEGMFMGSPKYMAPEQILGNPVSAATDVYALGVVGYELVCGKPPFDEGTSVKTMMAHLHQALPSLRERMAGRPLSAEFEAIVLRCLAKDSRERFESMDALLRALSLLDGEGLTDSLGGPRVWAGTATGQEGQLARVTHSGIPVLDLATGDAASRGEGRRSASGTLMMMTEQPARSLESLLAAGGPRSPISIPGEGLAIEGDPSNQAQRTKRIAAAFIAVAVVSLLVVVGLGVQLRQAGEDSNPGPAVLPGERAKTEAPSPPPSDPVPMVSDEPPGAAEMAPAPGAEPVLLTSADVRAPTAAVPVLGKRGAKGFVRRATPSALPESPASPPSPTPMPAAKDPEPPKGYKSSPY